MAHDGVRLTIAAFGLIVVGAAHAHDLADARGVASAVALVLGAALLFALAFYARGVGRVWQRAGVGHGIEVRSAVAFACGCAGLAAAIFGPLEALARESFAWHMVQHELLMVVVAPLLVCGRPLGAWSWALSPHARRCLGRAMRVRWIAWSWRRVTAPLAAWSLHAIALWVWHAPALFRAAAADEVLHAFQHGSFLLTALLFWWSVLSKAAAKPGLGVLLLFTTMIHTGALGALLVFSATDWYVLDADAETLSTQQLGGLIMWIPGGTVYLVAALLLVYRLLISTEKEGRSVQWREAA